MDKLRGLDQKIEALTLERADLIEHIRLERWQAR